MRRGIQNQDGGNRHVNVVLESRHQATGAAALLNQALDPGTADGQEYRLEDGTEKRHHQHNGDGGNEDQHWHLRVHWQSGTKSGWDCSKLCERSSTFRRSGILPR